MRTKILGFRILEHPEPWLRPGESPDEALAFHIEIDVAAFHDDNTFLGVRRVEIDHTLADFPDSLEAPHTAFSLPGGYSFEKAAGRH